MVAGNFLGYLSVPSAFPWSHATDRGGGCVSGPDAATPNRGGFVHLRPTQALDKGAHTFFPFNDEYYGWDLGSILDVHQGGRPAKRRRLGWHLRTRSEDLTHLSQLTQLRPLGT
jgi:hypothetical protein